MANEAYVAEKLAETAKSPKAMLLGAIGAMSSTPTNSANTAEELGISKEEIQGARWIALFKKGKTDLEFLKGLLEIIEKQKEEKMEKDEMISLEKEFKERTAQEDRDWDLVNKIHTLSLNGLILKPKGLFCKSCPKCGFKLTSRKVTRWTSAGPIIYTHYRCQCGYEYAK